MGIIIFYKLNMLTELLTSSFASETRDPTAPAEVIAGWLYGVTLNLVDERDAILTCYKTNVDLTNDYFDAMEDYEQGEMTAGAKAWAAASKLYPYALASCSSQVLDPLEIWGKKVE